MHKTQLVDIITADSHLNLYFSELHSNSFLWSMLNEIVLAGHNEQILRRKISQLARVGVYMRQTRSRGPTKRCITLPGVNKPRGRGLARGSPLRLRLCISSYRHPVHSLSSTSVDHNILSFPSLSLPLVRPRSSAHPHILSLSRRDCTKTADTAGCSVTRKLFSPRRTHLEDPPPHRYLF